MGRKSLIAFLAGVTLHSTKLSDKWFVDSGPYAHICNNKYSFFDLKEKKSDRTVSIGDGSALEMAGVGSFHATTVIDGEKQEVVREEVLFVPILFGNLISVSSCRKNGIKVTFTSAMDGRGLCIAKHTPPSRTVFRDVEST